MTFRAHPLDILVVSCDEPFIKSINYMFSHNASMAVGINDIIVTNTMKETLHTLHKKLDLILLDMDLEDSVGLNTLRRVESALFGRIPIIAISEKEESFLHREAIAIGAEEFLAKQCISSKNLVRVVISAVTRVAAHRKRRERNFNRLREAIAMTESCPNAAECPLRQLDPALAAEYEEKFALNEE